ncbi:MAG: efflux RND transporter permease subunit [Deltaproteobacteria bacterium]|nr:efflux RND transporter permease subunit [Deltaproteobacteria bacterium]
MTVNIPSPVGAQSNPIDLEIAGEDLSTLDIIALRVKDLFREINGIVDLDSSVRSGKPELRIRPQRAVLADLNIPASAIGMALRGNIEGVEAGSYKKGARSYDIRVKFAEKEGKDQVKGFLFPGEPGHPITLMNVARIEETLAPVQITRQDKRRISKVFGNLSADLPLGTAVEKLSEVIEKKGRLPMGYGYRFSGEFETFDEARFEFLEAGILAVLLTYLVLAAILESFLEPFIILFTIPLALIGFIWALYITGKSIDVFVLLGGVMLIGIVVNNAILIMDRIKRHRADGMPRGEAVVQAAVDELRPIIMITMAAVLGMLPFALGSGLGSELRSGIGIASVGGIFISGLLTLFILPALYNLFTRLEKTK